MLFTKRTILTPPGNIARDFLDGTQIIILRPDEQARWDCLVANAPNGHLLQCWAWGELKRAFGWTPLRIALWDPACQRLLAGAQVLLRPLPMIGYSLAYIPKGPVLNWSDTACGELFFAGLHWFLRSQRAAFLRIEPDVPKKVYPVHPEHDEALTPAPPCLNAGEAPLEGFYSAAQGSAVARQLNNIGFHPVQDHIQQLRTIVVDLTPDEEMIRQQQKPKWRYNTNLAARKGVTIRLAAQLTDLQRWYDLVEITRSRDRFASRTFSYYQRAWESLRAANQAELFLAEHAETLLAGILVTRVGRQSIYLYGASSNEDRHSMPNYLLQWEAMRWARSQGATCYDLWGIAETDDPDDPLAGVTQFKRGWGGKVVEYLGAFDYVYAPTVYRAFLVGRKLARN